MGRKQVGGISRDHSAWRALRTKLLRTARRTKPPCAICGIPINYRTRNPAAGDAPSIDHVKPWHTHPYLRLDPANLQIVHQACNKSKGTRERVPSVGNASRRWGHRRA